MTKKERYDSSARDRSNNHKNYKPNVQNQRDTKGNSQVKYTRNIQYYYCKIYDLIGRFCHLKRR